MLVPWRVTKLIHLLEDVMSSHEFLLSSEGMWRHSDEWMHVFFSPKVSYSRYQKVILDVCGYCKLM